MRAQLFYAALLVILRAAHVINPLIALMHASIAVGTAAKIALAAVILLNAVLDAVLIAYVIVI